MAEWIDTTTRSRHYPKGHMHNPVESNTWQLTLDGFAVVVTKRHRNYPDHWVMHCHALSIDTLPLKLNGDTPAENAQKKAVRIAHKKALKLAEAFAPFTYLD